MKVFCWIEKWTKYFYECYLLFRFNEKQLATILITNNTYQHNKNSDHQSPNIMTLTDPEVEVDNVFYTLSDDVYNKVNRALSFEKCFTLN